jgi:hypothetical protein
MLNVIMLSVIMLNVVMLSVIMLNVVILSVVMLSVVAPPNGNRNIIYLRGLYYKTFYICNYNFRILNVFMFHCQPNLIVGSYKELHSGTLQGQC